MSSQPEPARVGIRILEKEYFITCPHEERSALLDSAEFLNNRMREVRDGGKVVGLDRIAVMVALNLTNELLQLKKRDVKLESEAGARVRGARERVEAAIGKRQVGKGQQLEF